MTLIENQMSSWKTGHKTFGFSSIYSIKIHTCKVPIYLRVSAQNVLTNFD